MTIVGWRWELSIIEIMDRLREKRWLAKASEQQRAALKRDLLPVVEIYNQL